VVNAFNRNMPFDQFTIEQLAGDLLPGATREQRIATGFNRNNRINTEGGSLADEFQVEYVVDRVETTATVWLGSTLGCARCHDHKYDPFPQRDFYRFYAYFNHVPEAGVGNALGNSDPVLPLPTPEQQSEYDRLTSGLIERESKLSVTALAPLLAAWEKTISAQLPPAPREGLLAHYRLDGSFDDLSGNNHHGRLIRGDTLDKQPLARPQPAEAGGTPCPTTERSGLTVVVQAVPPACSELSTASGGAIDYQPGPVGRAAQLDGATEVVTGVALPAAFSVALWEQAEGLKQMIVLGNVADPQTRRGFEMLLDDSLPMPPVRGTHLIFRLVDRWPASLIEIRTRARINQKDWRHVVFTYDGSGKAAGAHVYLDGKPLECEVTHDALSDAPSSPMPLAIGNRTIGAPFHGGLDDLRIYSRPLSQEEAERLASLEPLRAALLAPAGKRTKEEQETLRRYFLTHDAPEDLRRGYAEYTSMFTQRDALNHAIPTVMVMREMEQPRDTFVLAKGDYRNRTEKVTPGIPAALMPPEPSRDREGANPSLPSRDREGANPSLPSRDREGANRLGLARWLVDPANPLTARVTVNRYWAMYFGTGLVRTVEDFGSQGEAPSHPELLDWLATEFVRTGWDVKSMQRLIVTSATYRQASAVSPLLRERDPENRLLARGPRFRLPAEMIRDNALAAAGLLNGAIGGPSVFPYQPDGLWEETSVGDVYTAQTYTQSHGKDLYRRSLYTFWKRTVPAPSLAVFDAPDREKCTARRTLTNTPMQALTLLNDPAYVEAARALAERALNEAAFPVGQDSVLRPVSNRPAASSKRAVKEGTSKTGASNEAASKKDGPSKRAAFLFRLATSREPSREEERVLADLAARSIARYRKQPQDALKLLGVGESKFDTKLDPAELAGWTIAAAAVLNLDETVTKD
jgi:hypothetical protein